VVSKRNTKGVKRGKRIKNLPTKTSGAKGVRGGDGFIDTIGRQFGWDSGVGDGNLGGQKVSPVVQSGNPMAFRRGVK